MAKTNKRELLKRLLKIEGRQPRTFWAREMKALKDLMSKFEDEDFWSKVNFSESFNSLLFLKSKEGQSILQKKYLEFNYKIPEKISYKIGKVSGEDRLYNSKPKTIKDFLNE